MRVLLLAILSMMATAARAEDWRVLYWDRHALVALDANSIGEPSPDRRVVRMIRSEISFTDGPPSLHDSVEELDCAEGRVRQRQMQQVAPGEPLGVIKSIEPWRDRGADLDRSLVAMLCQEGRLERLPLVSDAPREEALAALAQAEKAPDMLAVDPVVGDWAQAYAVLSPKAGLGGVPSLMVILQSPHPFAVLKAGPGWTTMVSTNIEKVDEGRYRAHVLDVGAFKRPDMAAQWSYREFDCASKRSRVLAYAGFNSKAAELFGHEAYVLQQPFQAVSADTPLAGALTMACQLAERPFAEVMEQFPVVVMSTMQEAIDGYGAYHSPTPLTLAGLGPPSPWKAAYGQLCGPLGCETHRSIDLAIKVVVGLLFSALLAVATLLVRRYRRRSVPSAEPEPQGSWIVR